MRREPETLRSELSRRLCSAFGARDALLVSSGTTALQLALSAARAHARRGPMALPAYTCYDVASAANGAEVDVLLYDVDPTSLGPEPDSLCRVLAQEPAAVVGAHLYGYPVDMERLSRLAAEAGAVVIEDAAQAAGGRLCGVPLGSFGSVSVLSFGRGKGTTTGAGGALLAHDDIGERLVAWAAQQVLPAARGFRECSLLAAQWAFGRPRTYWLPSALPFLRLGETVFHPPVSPRAMSLGALGALSVAGAAENDLPRRRAIADRLVSLARRSSRARAIEPIPGAEPGYLRLPVRLERRPDPGVLRGLGRSGVAAGYPMPLAALAHLARRTRNRTADFTGARVLAQTLHTFPTHALVAEEDLKALSCWLCED